MMRDGRRGEYVGRAFEHLAMRAKKYQAQELPREYARLQRDPRVQALETPPAN